MPKPRKPGPIPKADKANYETLIRAFGNGDTCLISAVRKSDGKRVSLICAIECRDGTFYPTPLAVMAEGDPFEDYEDPTVE